MRETLMLLENPRRRGRRRKYNPVGFDDFGNPILLEGGRNMYGMHNPRRRRRRRNPALAMPATVREWTQGIDLMDAGAAVGGLAASTMVPGMLVKPTPPAAELTTMQKILKLAASLGCAIGAGAIGRAMVSPAAGKAAIIGGVAGTAAQALGMFTAIQIGRPSPRRTLSSGRGIGETMTISPRTPEGEQTGIILP